MAVLRRRSGVTSVIIAAAFVLFVACIFPFWSVFEYNVDEGGNLAKAALVAEGFPLYSEIWSDQAPLVTWMAAGLFRFTGPSMLAGRLLVLGFAAMFVGMLFRLLLRRYGSTAALGGVCLLVLSPHFVTLSATFMIGLVAVSLFVAALAALGRADEASAGAGPWLALSGVLTALAAAAKLFVLPLVALLGVTAVWRHRRRSLVFVVALLSTAAVVAWLCGIDAWRQLSEPHVVAFRGSHYWGTRRLFVARRNAGLLLLAGVGCVVALRRRDWLPVLCLSYGLAVVSFHRPLHFHHVVLLTVPAAWLAAIAIGALVDGANLLAPWPRRVLLAGGALFFAAVAARGARDLWYTTADVVARDARARDQNRIIVSALRSHRGARPWVLTDRPTYAVAAGLSVLPELAILSNKRMAMLSRGPSDFFTSLLEKYEPDQVLLLRHENYPPAFTERVSRDYVRLTYDVAAARHFVAPAAVPPAPSLADFREGIAHYESVAAMSYPRYPESDFIDIADSMLLRQHLDGGWPANSDPRARLTASDRKALARRLLELESQRVKSSQEGRIYRRRKGSSLDNGATIAEIGYLMRVYDLTADESYRESARRGIEYLLASQTGCGGWPHSDPPTERYHPHLTILDDVTVRALRLLGDAAQGRGELHALSPELRSRARAAHARGLACLLALQVRIGAELTGWAGQYDEVTLVPASGRSFELPGLASRETVAIVEYLLTIDDPSPQVVEAIEGAVRWLRASRLNDTALGRLPDTAPGAGKGQAGDDSGAEPSPPATDLWARFYEIPSNRPFVADRRGQRLYDWTDLPPEQRFTYDWYGPFAESLLRVDYPAWRARREIVATRPD